MKEIGKFLEGVYTRPRNINGSTFTTKLPLSGNRWTASSKLGFDSPEFQNGLGKKNALYDESGMFNIWIV
jgi:hypothetical protein